MKIKIMSLRKDHPNKKYDFFIDRRSSLGNPFLLEHESNRKEVIKEYKRWFKRRIKQQNTFVLNDLKKIKKALKKHGKVRLFCWCAPQSCHGDIIKKYLKGEIKCG